MIKNLVLLIQGPINSISRKDDLQFDCKKLLEEKFNSYLANFNKIIISTWEKETLPEIYENKKKIIIIKSKLIFFKKQLDDSGIYNDGGSRQIETLFNIIKYIEDDSFILKIRTDMVFNLNKVLEEIKTNYNGNNMFFLGGREKWLDDVIFGANGKDFKEFSKNLKLIQHEKKNVHIKFFESLKKTKGINTNLYDDNKHFYFFSREISVSCKIRNINSFVKIKLCNPFFKLPRLLYSSYYFRKLFLKVLEYFFHMNIKNFKKNFIEEEKLAKHNHEYEDN